MNKDTYFIIKVVPCPDCSGSGVRTRYKQDSNSSKMYPVDYDCGHCGGAGKIERKVSLEEGLRELGVEVKP